MKCSHGRCRSLVFESDVQLVSQRFKQSMHVCLHAALKKNSVGRCGGNLRFPDHKSKVIGSSVLLVSKATASQSPWRLLLLE